MPNVEDLVKQYNQRYVALDNDRSQQIPIWRDIRDYIVPRTARFSGEQVNSGVREDLKILNGTPRFAARTLASGLQSGVTNPLRPWFRLGTSDPGLAKREGVKQWLSECEEILRTIFSRSNFYDRSESNYGILGSYGTSCLYIDKDHDKILRCFDLLMGSFAIATNESGRVDVVYRDITMTTIQMVQKFTLKRVPQLVKDAYDRGNYEQRFQLCHIIEPNRNYKPGSALNQYKKYASIWLDKSRKGEESIIEFSGYDYMPALVSRWEVVGENTWGTGCGEVALGDCKQLQKMEANKLKGIDKNVDPPMNADASMRTHRMSQLPGSTNYVNGLISGKPAYQPVYQVNPYLGELKEEIAVVKERIDEAYFKNLFLMIAEMGDQPNITATQINMMREEKLMMLGPVLERLNEDRLGPVIDITFNMAQERGILPPPPEELQGMELKVEYISVLAQAQKALGIGNVERFIGFVGNMTQFDPTVVDKVDFDAVIEEYADGVALPPKLVRSQDQTEEIRVSRQQQQQQAEAMEVGMGAAQAAKTLSETSTTGDNVLAQFLR